MNLMSAIRLAGALPMIDILEDNDDVQKVHHNCSVDLEEVE